jgi:hypothetical protein
MFSLRKLTFKAKVIIVSLIVIVISMGLVYLRNTYSITVVKINDWVLISSNVEGNWYYKANSINVIDNNNVIKVWVKIIYSDKGKQDFLKIHKENKYHDIDRSLSMVSIDYHEMKYQEDRVIHYSNSDIIGSDELSVEGDDFIPKSVGAKLLVKILKDSNIKR